MALLNENRTSNADGSTSFSANVQVGNASGVPSGPMRLRVLARAGYSTLLGSPNPGLLPADQVLAVYNLADPAGVQPGTTTNFPVSVVCPPPIIIDPQKVGFGWGVFVMLEEQVGTNWFAKDRDLLGYGLWPTIGGFVGPGGGVIRIDPAVGGSSFNPVSLTNVSVLGPSIVNSGSSANFYGAALFDNGSVDFFTNTTWIVSPATAGTIGSNGKFNAANVATDTSATITCYYFYDATNSATRKITVHASPPPVITSQPSDETVLAGSNAVFHVAASSSTPLGYQWYFFNNPLTDATTDTLNLSDVQPGQAGSYYAVISNAAGSVTSAIVQLTVLSRPIITTQPGNQVVVAGTNLALHVGVSGTPPFSYQWFLSGQPLVGAASETLTYSNVQPDQAGSYYVIITNSVGSATSDVARITVLVPPAITSEPADQRIIVGGTAIFQIGASGSPPLSYQWFLGSSLLAGASSATLTISNIQPNQAGAYSVTITNAAGTAMSSLAQLTVLSPPTISLNSSSITAAGVAISLSSALGLSYTLEYKDSLSDSSWTPLFPALPGTGQTITLADTNSPPLGGRFYRVLTQ
jgi:hypothetical protein